MKDSRYERPSSLAKYCYGNHELSYYRRSSPCPTEGLFATVDSLKFLIRISLRSLGCTSEKYFYLMTFLWYVFSVLGGIVSFCFVRLPLLMQRFREDWCFSFLLSIWTWLYYKTYSVHVLTLKQTFACYSHHAFV